METLGVAFRLARRSQKISTIAGSRLTIIHVQVFIEGVPSDTMCPIPSSSYIKKLTLTSWTLARLDERTRT